MNSSDRRETPRVRLAISVAVEWAGGRLNTTSGDVAETGMFLCSDKDIPLGTRVTLRFNVPYGRELVSLAPEGVVARSVSLQQADELGCLAGFGVQFKRLCFRGDSLHSFLEERLESISTQESPRVALPNKRDARRRLPVQWGEAPSELNRTGYLVAAAGLGSTFALETSERVPKEQELFLWASLPDALGGKPLKGIMRALDTAASRVESSREVLIALYATNKERELVRGFLAPEVGTTMANYLLAALACDPVPECSQLEWAAAEPPTEAPGRVVHNQRPLGLGRTVRLASGAALVALILGTALALLLLFSARW